MRLSSTPATWRPSPRTRRFKEYSEEGLPWITTLVGIAATAVAVGITEHDLVRMVTVGRYDWPPFAVVAVAVAVAALCAYLAFTRYFLEPDGFIEIDPVSRTMLSVKRSGLELRAGHREAGKPVRDWVSAFEECSAFAIATQRVETTYVDRHTRARGYTDSKTTVRLVALPSGVVVFSDASAGSVRRVAEHLRAVSGKPMLDMPQQGPAPMPPGMQVGARVEVPARDGTVAVGNVARYENGYVEVLFRGGVRAWVPVADVRRG